MVQFLVIINTPRWRLFATPDYLARNQDTRLILKNGSCPFLISLEVLQIQSSQSFWLSQCVCVGLWSSGKNCGIQRNMLGFSLFSNFAPLWQIPLTVQTLERRLIITKLCQRCFDAKLSTLVPDFGCFVGQRKIKVCTYRVSHSEMRDSKWLWGVEGLRIFLNYGS